MKHLELNWRLNVRNDDRFRREKERSINKEYYENYCHYLNQVRYNNDLNNNRISLNLFNSTDIYSKIKHDEEIGQYVGL